MTLNTRDLQRFSHAAVVQPGSAEDPSRPPLQRDLLVLGVGNSGETVSLRTHAIAYTDGAWLPVAGLNNDRLPPRPLPVRRPDGTSEVLALVERLVLDGDHPRERVQDDPVLAPRYAALLRGVPVFETYPRAGAGGHGLPTISALDMDLHSAELLGWLRRQLRVLRDAPTPTGAASDLQQLVMRAQRRPDTPREKRIVMVGGAAGAMGNAGHHLLPPLIRHILAEQGIANYQLWGVLLGPRAFTGLTPYVRQNTRALLEAIEHMSRHGMQRAYGPDLLVRTQQPPYDRVFLLDDPAIPAAGATATEAELEHFFDRAALSLATLLRGTTWPTIASHIANDDGVPREDGQLRYLHTVQSALVAADRPRLRELLASAIAGEVTDRFLARFAA
jgi:hypothetical protein